MLRHTTAAIVALAALLLLPAATSQAHQFAVTEVHAVFSPHGTYRLDIRVDVDALALGVSPAADSEVLAARLRAMDTAGLGTARQRARQTLARRIRLRFDGEPVKPRISFPGPDATGPGEPVTILGITARLEGEVPPAASSFTFFASRAFNAVSLLIEDQATGKSRYLLLQPGEESPAMQLGGPGMAGGGSAWWRFLSLGFLHILPHGLDHILFILGLFLLSERLRPLLWQVTAFTVAHSVTLALSLYGVVSLPRRPVETLIALSIAYVAVENLFTRELMPWRPALVFAFGLLHGMGFASVLRDLGVPRDQFLPALLSFNLGVELGQLAVIAVALVLLFRLRGKRAYRRWVVVPASGAIALTGLIWAAQRVLGPA